MQQLNPKLVIRVNKRAVRPILTLRQITGVAGAETSLKPLRVIHLFGLVVRIPT